MPPSPTSTSSAIRETPTAASAESSVRSTPIDTDGIEEQLEALREAITRLEIQQRDGSDELVALDEDEILAPGLVATATDVVVNGETTTALLLRDEFGVPIGVPLRVVVSMLGYPISWDARTASVTVGSPRGNVSFYVGTTEFVVEDRILAIATPSIAARGRVYVPLTFWRDVFGADVVFDAGTLFVTATTADELRITAETVDEYGN
jgi:hypothetical protein